MRKLSILFLPSMIGKGDLGGATHQVELVNNLAGLVNLHMMSGRRFEGPIGSIDASSLPKLPPGEMSLMHRLTYMIRIALLGLALSRKGEVDIIYARHGVATIPAIFLSRMADLPLIIEVNGIMSEEGSIDKGRIYSSVLTLLDRLGCHYSSRIVAVTLGIKRYMVEKLGVPARNVVVIPNGVNARIFRPMDAGDCRRKLGLDSKAKYVLFAGNLAPWQGVEHLIRAMKAVCKAVPEARLLIVGDGESRKTLERLSIELGMNDRVEFTGKVGYEQVPLYINSSDLCVAYKKPLRSGYSALKVLEYMACGKPVIASRTEGFEMIEKSSAGILVMAENTRMLADAVIKLLGDRELRSRMGEKARKSILAEQSWESVARRIEKEYRSIYKKSACEK